MRMIIQNSKAINYKAVLLMLSTVFVVSTFFIGQNSRAATAIAERVKGYILLQVEQNGEAWYVNPDNLLRYYMGRPRDAFDLMRSQGVGISNDDIAKIPIGLQPLSGIDTDSDGLSDIFEDAIASDKTRVDTDNDGFNDYTEVQSGLNPTGSDKLTVDNSLVERLKGKILLQVQNHGEAWYVNPVDGKRYFLGRPHDALTIMRKLSLGITNEDLNQVGRGDLDLTSNLFSLNDVGVGNRVAGMTIISIDPYLEDAPIPLSEENVKILFSGQATVKGSYRYNLEDGIYGGQVCFSLDESSQSKLPALKSLPKPDISFCLSKEDSTKGYFDPIGNTGAKTIAISDYVINSYPTTLSHSARLVSATSANWLDYTNQEYGFEISYPNDWVSDSPAYGGKYLSGPEKTGNAHHVLGLASKYPVGDWSILVTVIPTSIDSVLADPNYYWNKYWEVKNREIVLFGSLNWEKVTWSNDEVLFYIQNDTGSLTVQFDGYGSGVMKDESNQILSTFRFLD